MKKVVLLFIALVVLVGCASLETVRTVAPEFNQENFAGIGDTFFRTEEKTVMKDPVFGEYPQGGDCFDLTIVELNDQKIGLQYSEYTYYNTPYASKSGWVIKDGFNKRFDYQLADRIVRFKSYEFEILEVKGGQIKYRRVK